MARKLLQMSYQSIFQLLSRKPIKLYSGKQSQTLSILILKQHILPQLQQNFS